MHIFLLGTVKIYVGNILSQNHERTKSRLKFIFERYGTVKNIEVKKDMNFGFVVRMSKLLMGYAYIYYIPRCVWGYSGFGMVAPTSVSVNTFYTLMQIIL